MQPNPAASLDGHKMNLRAPVYKQDKRPLLSGCTCYACSNHSRCGHLPKMPQDQAAAMHNSACRANTHHMQQRMTTASDMQGVHLSLARCSRDARHDAPRPAQHAPPAVLLCRRARQLARRHVPRHARALRPGVCTNQSTSKSSCCASSASAPGCARAAQPITLTVAGVCVLQRRRDG